MEPPPVPLEFHPAYIEDPRERHRSRTNSVAMNRDMPGDKTGQLQLKKGNNHTCVAYIGTMYSVCICNGY